MSHNEHKQECSFPDRTLPESILGRKTVKKRLGFPFNEINDYVPKDSVQSSMVDKLQTCM